MNVGLDPELLVINSAKEGVAASHFLAPPERGEDGKLPPLSFDNAAVELRPEHSHKPQTLVHRTGHLLKEAIEQTNSAAIWNKIPKTARLTLKPCVNLREEDMNEESVSVFGCSSSKVVRDDNCMEAVEPLADAKETRIRSAGYHLHGELYSSSAFIPATMVLDGLLGLLDVIMNYEAGWEYESRKRRQVLGYGRAGEFRTRYAPDGAIVLEYRTLTPWPLAAPQFVRYTTDVMQRVCSQTTDHLVQVLDNYPSREHLIAAINTVDHRMALTLWSACMNAWHKVGRKSVNDLSNVGSIKHIRKHLHSVGGDIRTICPFEPRKHPWRWTPNA